MEKDQIVDSYRAIRSDYELATAALHSHVKTALDRQSDIEILEIANRTKEVDSLIGKLGRAERKFERHYEVHDLAGVCVVVFFSSDINKVKNILEASGIEIDRGLSTDKRLHPIKNAFGYSAYHLICRLDSVPGVPESLRGNGALGEIQIRTGFVHIWAKIEHKYQYKRRDSVAEKKEEIERAFARVASLVEMADEELNAVVGRDRSREQWGLTDGVLASVLAKRISQQIDESCLAAYPGSLSIRDAGHESLRQASACLFTAGILSEQKLEEKLEELSTTVDKLVQEYVRQMIVAHGLTLEGSKLFLTKADKLEFLAFYEIYLTKCAGNPDLFEDRLSEMFHQLGRYHSVSQRSDVVRRVLTSITLL